MSRRKREWLDQVMTRNITLHLKTDQTIEGLLVANYTDGVVLRSASLLNSGAPATPMAGEVYIPRSNVLMAQLEANGQTGSE